MNEDESILQQAMRVLEDICKKQGAGIIQFRYVKACVRRLEEENYHLLMKNYQLEEALEQCKPQNR
jgi:hypothetical protein